VIESKLWRQTNASRYVRAFQSRRSLLVWKLFGQRLDGWTNADHPTETTPGNAATLPVGADPNAADLNYSGAMMPPPGSGYALTHDERMLFVRWIDLGCPINYGDDGATPWGWFLDEIRPTLEVSSPRAGAHPGALGAIRVGIADANSGLAPDSLSVTADFAVGGRPAGVELADLAVEVAPGVYEIAVSASPPSGAPQHVYAQVMDNQGNWTRVDRAFAVDGAAPTPTPRPTTTPVITPTPGSSPGSAACPASPRTGCRSAFRAQLRVNAAGRRLQWRWIGATSENPATAGDPVSGPTGYTLCVYDAAGLKLTTSVPAGGTCGGAPCWRALAKGALLYTDAGASADGITRLSIELGRKPRPRLALAGLGPDLTLPSLPFASGPVRAQMLRTDDASRCWESTFPSALENSTATYRARLP
jgi:hypothetical protein